MRCTKLSNQRVIDVINEFFVPFAFNATADPEVRLAASSGVLSSDASL